MITEKISNTEKRKLKKLLEPYGAIKDCASKTGVHRTTIARVLKTGEASGDIVQKIRVYLSGFASRMFIEPATREAA
jgi:hypothetical protein